MSFANDHKMGVTMKSHLKETGRAYGKMSTRTLFEIIKEFTRLEPSKAVIFHHIVAKVLYVTKIARVNFQLVIAFFCTRVSKSTKEDLGKLRRLLKYIHVTIDQPKIIGAEDLGILQTWVDASYAIHPGMRSHTGAVISLEHRVINSKSSKQKINTKSSTEAELVGASDYISHTLLTSWFLKGQGYMVNTNLFYQDNQSAILLEKNGRNSCGDRSRHINIRYFFY